MADKVAEQTETEVCTKKKEVESPIKEKKQVEEKSEKENGANGDVCDTENGKGETEEVDAKESGDLVCPVKRKSGAGVETDEKSADECTPDKKAKLDEAEAEAEAEVAA